MILRVNERGVSLLVSCRYVSHVSRRREYTLFCWMMVPPSMRLHDARGDSIHHQLPGKPQVQRNQHHPLPRQASAAYLANNVNEGILRGEKGRENGLRWLTCSRFPAVRFASFPCCGVRCLCSGPSLSFVPARCSVFAFVFGFWASLLCSPRGVMFTPQPY